MTDRAAGQGAGRARGVGAGRFCELAWALGIEVVPGRVFAERCGEPQGAVSGKVLCDGSDRGECSGKGGGEGETGADVEEVVARFAVVADLAVGDGEGDPAAAREWGAAQR